MPLFKRCKCSLRNRCSHRWHFEFRVAGNRHRQTTLTSNRWEARRIETHARKQIVAEHFNLPDRVPRKKREEQKWEQGAQMPLLEFFEHYMKTHARVRTKGSTISRTNVAWVAIGRHMGSCKLGAIDGEMLARYIAIRIRDGLKPASINRELAVISSMLIKALEWGYLPRRPIVRMLRVINQRTAWLMADQQDRLEAALAADPRGRPHVPKIQLLRITGARIGEVLGLRWGDCAGGELIFRNTKNGETRRLPIIPEIRRILDALPRNGDYVFPSVNDRRKPCQYSTVALPFKAAVLAAGLPSDVTLHTLRHSLATRMVIQQGVPQATVMAITGHRSPNSLMRYTHPSREAMLQALSGFPSAALAPAESAERIRKPDAERPTLPADAYQGAVVAPIDSTRRVGVGHAGPRGEFFLGDPKPVT